MSGIKIINVLKDDSLAEILELFRQAPAGEVIFVLPKNSKVFKKEDHFAAFASEAANSGKTISILASSPGVAAMARAFKFNVMSAGKAKKEKEPEAKLASAPPPSDDDIQDTNEDAYDTDSRVVTTADESMNVTGAGDEAEAPEGFHIEDAEGPVDIDEDEDGNADEPSAKDLTYGDDADLTAAPAQAPVATLAAVKPKPRSSVDGVRVATRKAAPAPVTDDSIDVPVSRGPAPAQELMEPVPAPAPAPRSEAAADLDYIDAVWRQKAAAQQPTDSPVAPRAVAPSRWGFIRFFHLPSLPTGGPVMASKRMVTGALVLAVLLLGAAVYLTAGRAAVTITPQSREVNVQLTVQASDAFAAVDAAFSKIPGQLFEVSKSATAEAAATGQREVASKARVKITVANEYSSTPQTLVATTRFATPDGLVFRTLQTVSVPGSTVKEGKPVAGTVTVEAIADKPGEQYNVPAGKWTIVAFTERGDTDRAAKIYGTSAEPASGGASGPSKVVTQEDYDKARAEAVGNVTRQITEAFAAQQTGLRILDEAEPVLGEVTATARPDDAAEKTVVTAAGTLRTVAFRQSDLETLVRDAVLSRERLVVVPSQLTLTFGDVAFNDGSGVLSFSVNIAGPGYSPVDAAAIRNDIKGRNAAQVQDYFRDREGVHSATVSLRPFWVRRIPESDDRIDIRVLWEAPRQGN